MYKLNLKDSERVTLSHNNYSVTLTLKSNPSQEVLKYFYNAGFQCIKKIDEKAEEDGDSKQKTRKSKDI
jgi:hypothetical protein